MKRVFNIDLVAAEFIKVSRSRYVQTILLYGLFSVVVVIYAYALNTHQSSLRAPACLATFAEAAYVIGLFIPSLVGGWLSGHEAGGDTWKTLLVRQPTRLPFVVAKVVAGSGVVLAAVGIAFIASLALFDLTGRVIGVLPAPDEGAGLGDAFVLLLHAAASGAVSFALGLVTTSNSTAIGVAGGIMVQWLFAVMASNGTNLTCVHHAERLVRHLMGDSDVTRLEVIGSAVAVCCWTVVPIAVAALVFQRRDLVSDA
jgi:ABC-type transport system involved in multi-copper enzyme maturation permease subunit